MQITKTVSYFFTFIPMLIAVFLWNMPSHADPGTPSYVIGPNDVLHIYVWKEPELTRDITVMSDGKISFPLIGEVMAEGKTVTQLKETITESLKNYIDVPEITVIVSQSLSKQIYTIGSLNGQGSYPLAANMTVIQALSTAGGLGEWANKKNILIIRREGEKEVQLRFNYKEYVSGKHPEQNIILKPGDTIVVP